jgi:hypothetical protein
MIEIMPNPVSVSGQTLSQDSLKMIINDSRSFENPETDVSFYENGSCAIEARPSGDRDHLVQFTLLISAEI